MVSCRLLRLDRRRLGEIGDVVLGRDAREQILDLGGFGTLVSANGVRDWSSNIKNLCWLSKVVQSSSLISPGRQPSWSLGAEHLPFHRGVIGGAGNADLCQTTSVGDGARVWNDSMSEAERAENLCARLTYMRCDLCGIWHRSSRGAGRQGQARRWLR